MLHDPCLGTFGGPIFPWLAMGGYDGEFGFCYICTKKKQIASAMNFVHIIVSNLVHVVIPLKPCDSFKVTYWRHVVNSHVTTVRFAEFTFVRLHCLHQLKTSRQGSSLSL